MNMEGFMSQLSLVLASKDGGRLTSAQAIEIFELREDIKALKDFGITTKNYTNKKRAYFKFVKKAYDEYAIELDAFPFKHPHKLNVQIYNIMLDNGLNTSQIIRLYKELDLEKPTKSDIENHTQHFLKLYEKYKNSEEDITSAIEDIDIKAFEEHKQHEEYLEAQKQIHRNKFKRVLISPID